MAKAVFTAKPNSTYDDLVEVRYHFPAKYLRYVESALRDWIVYYEPRRPRGMESYFATARVESIEADTARSGHYYAYVGSYLDFDAPVPWRINESDAFESRLLKSDGSANRGRFGWAVRDLPDAEFELILAAGFDISRRGEDAYYGKLQPLSLPELIDHVAEAPRRIAAQLVHRPFRDQAFRHAVRRAYQNTCAFTGLSILNGGGRPEVQAAHIQAVEDHGPDSIRNGIALSGTVHWMFDRGLLALGDDYEILVKRDKVPSTVSDLLLPSGKMRLPEAAEDHPLPEFIRRHRRMRFEALAR